MHIKSIFLISGLLLFPLLPGSFVFCGPETGLSENENYPAGDANKDGVVDWNDIQEITKRISGQPGEACPDCDVNCDGKLTYSDVNYLRNFIAQAGPAPCVKNAWSCSVSPCTVKIGEQIVELTADSVKESQNRVRWSAFAYSTAQGYKKELARFSLVLEYGQPLSLDLSYERKNSPLGLPDIAYTTATGTMPAPYNNNTLIHFDTTTAFTALSLLLKSNLSSNKIPRSPDYDNDFFGILDIQDAAKTCYIKHDFCYQAGGNELNKEACDKKFTRCLQILSAPEGVERGIWSYRKEYLSKLLVLFRSSSFRSHSEDYTCNYGSKGEKIDRLLDNGALTNDCSACQGKDACDENCIVVSGDDEIKYRCVKCLAAKKDFVDFYDFPVTSYEAMQDVNAQVSIFDEGAGLRLTGNGWKMLPYAYSVNENTVLEFDFESDKEGDLHAIGFDIDNNSEECIAFQLYGRQEWGVSDYKDYEKSSGESKHYKIYVGKYVSGDYKYLFFVNDHDVEIPDAESIFKNIRVYDEKGNLAKFILKSLAKFFKKDKGNFAITITQPRSKGNKIIKTGNKYILP